eukprot:scaffold17158_cov66-Phaeocystis_antarctica.AAC.4
MVSHTTTTRMLRNSAMPGSLTPNAQRYGILAMTIRPLKPRDSARSALLTAVRSRLSGLAVHPRRVLHGPAAPDWRGGIRVGRTSWLKQRSATIFDSE